MAVPSSRQELIDYCLRKLGEPVIHVNVAEEQIDDLVDDALQLFHERHFDGVEKMFLKYQITQDDIDRGSANNQNPVGIVTTTASSVVNGQTINFNFQETSNFIQIPDTVIGIDKVWKFDTSSISGGIFNVKYQLFLNDLYYFNSFDLLTYSMVKTYLEDINYLLTTDKQVRFNRRQNRLYLDIDWNEKNAGDYLVIECYRILDPNEFTKVYNDSFLKMYLTSLIKRQWGQNLIKYQGVKLPGGTQFNGRQLYDDALSELNSIQERMISEYELPPLDFVG